MEVVRGAPPPPPPPIIFKGRNWPQQTIYHWKGNLMASWIHFKYWKNILISRLYGQFSRNDSAMAPERLFKKVSNLQNINILKHVVWRLRIYNYFQEIFKFRENMSKTDFAKFLKVLINREIWTFRESNYIFEISRPRALKWYITCSYFKSMKFFEQPFGAIAEPFCENCL